MEAWAHAGCQRSAQNGDSLPTNNWIVDGHQPRGPAKSSFRYWGLTQQSSSYNHIIISSNHHHIIIAIIISPSSSSSSSMCSNLPLRQSWVWPTIIFLVLRIAKHQSQDRKGRVLPKGSSWRRFFLLYVQLNACHIHVCI